jgi:hypothetical protein
VYPKRVWFGSEPLEKRQGVTRLLQSKWWFQFCFTKKKMALKKKHCSVGGGRALEGESPCSLLIMFCQSERTEACITKPTIQSYIQVRFMG